MTRDSQNVQSLRPISFARWVLAFLASYAVMGLIFVGLAGLAMNLFPGQLLLPYVMLLCSGLTAAVLTFWARQAYDRPKACAIRLALASFFGSNLFMLTVLVSVVKLGVLQESTAYGYAPYILPGSALGAISVYVVARKKLEIRMGQDGPRS